MRGCHGVRGEIKVDSTRISDYPLKRLTKDRGRFLEMHLFLMGCGFLEVHLFLVGCAKLPAPARLPEISWEAFRALGCFGSVSHASSRIFPTEMASLPHWYLAYPPLTLGGSWARSLLVSCISPLPPSRWFTWSSHPFVPVRSHVTPALHQTFSCRCRASVPRDRGCASSAGLAASQG